MVRNLSLIKQKIIPTDLSKSLLALLICLLPLLIGLTHDIYRPYTITPDADLIYLGQVLRLADGLNQTYFDHTGHNHFLDLAKGFHQIKFPGNLFR